MHFPISTTSLHINGQEVRVHAISTGMVAVKEKFRETKLQGFWGQLSFLLARKFTEWMPIWVWVIEHPEGVFVIDTGENSDINNPGYFKSSGWFENWLNTTQFKFKVEREEEIDRQLKQVGIGISDVKQVLLTHTHLDHIDGLRHFPDTEILVHDLEWKKPFGDLPKLYPEWFSPRLVTLNESYGPFDKTLSITADKKLRMIHTPGHSWGHCSFLLETDEGNVFFGADVCYYQGQLSNNKFAGGNASHKLAVETYMRIKNFAKSTPIVFLPSHDADCGRRLIKMETL